MNVSSTKRYIVKKIKQKFINGQFNKTCVIIALIHWLLSFFSDRLIFDYVTWDFENLTQSIKTAMTVGAKAVFLLVLLLVWQGIRYFVKKADRRFVRNTLIYFAINLAVLLLVWPGIWRMDEFGILNSATLLLPVFWQNYLTSLFYVFSLMLIPAPVGIVIVQCACIALLAGYVITWFEKGFGRLGLLSFIPLLFFPVLDSNLYPMRMSLYAFLELALVILLLETRQQSEKLAKCILLATVVTVWRTEAVYYFVFFPLLLIVLLAKKLDKKKLVRSVCSYLVLTLILFVPQTLGNRLTSGSQYDLTSVVLPLVDLIQKEDEVDPDSEELKKIDAVVSVDEAIEGAREGKNGISLFWSDPDFVRTDYTAPQYAQFKNAYYHLILKHPGVFLKERFTCFMQSEDLLENTTELFDKEGVANYDTFRGYPLTKPVNKELRSRVICLLEWRHYPSYTDKKVGYSLIYSPILPIILLLLCWGYCLVRKKWPVFFILSLPLIKLPLILLTAPSRLFMYYYSLYLIGYVLFFYIIIRLMGPVLKTVRYAKRNGAKAAFYAALERVDHVHVDAATKKALAYVGNKDWGVASYDGKTTEDFEHAVSGSGHSTISGKAASLVSIVVPTYETKKEFLYDLLNCVVQQTYQNWELVLADASHSDLVEKNVAIFKTEHADDLKGDKADRIRYIRLTENKGISDNTNAAIREAKGDYIALLDHDDLLTFDALEKMTERLVCDPNVAKCDENGTNSAESGTGGYNSADILAVYSDEDKCDTRAERFYDPNFKPDFNPDLLLSNNYICHFLMVRSDAMKKLLLRAAYDGAQDYDLLLRLAILSRRTGQKILHTPYVLYHWRCHEDSTAVNTESKRYAYDAGREALKDYYKQMGMEGQALVKDSAHLGFYDTTYVPDIFAVRKDVAAVCGRVVKDGVVVGGPDDLFTGLKRYSSGYLHRADVYMEVKACDERALRVSPSLEESLEEALKKGMKLVYDPNYIVEL